MAAVKLETIQAIMNQPANIRNCTIIGTVEHGRLELEDVLDERAGLRLNCPAEAPRPVQRKVDGDEDEDKERRAPSITLYHREILPEPEPEEEELHIGRQVSEAPEAQPAAIAEPEQEPQEFILNLIDSQGYADFSTDKPSALRISDGALVVVNCIEGMAFATETALRQALGERIKPVMAINGLDQGFLMLQMDWESFYNNLVKHIDRVNSVVDTYHDDTMGDNQVHPSLGSVAFTAGAHQWGFTLPQFARFYSRKFKISEEKMCDRLWGDYYFVPVDKQWKRSGLPQFRAFNLFILDPIGKIFSACMNDQMEKLNKMLVALGFRLKKGDLELGGGKELLKRCMRTWLPMDKALLDMLTKHLPSPVQAQKYRADILYAGPADELDECYRGIRECSPTAPLMLYVSKMAKAAEKGRYIAFGRVFAGAASADSPIRIMGPNYLPGRKEDLFAHKRILGMIFFAGKRQEPVDCVIAGNIVGLTGIDHFLTTAGTLTSSQEAWPICELTRSTSPVVRCAVQPLDPMHLPKVMDALRELKLADSLVHVVVEENGKINVCGPHQHHLEAAVDELRNSILSHRECPLQVSDLVVSYTETVSQAMTEACISISPNSANRIFFKATPLTEYVSKQIEAGEITFRESVAGDDEISDIDDTDFAAITSFAPDSPLKAKKSVADGMLDRQQRISQMSLAKRVEVETGRRVWAFGPGTRGPNILLDATRGNSGALHEVKDSICASFAWVTKEGVLCEENMRGVGMKVIDVALHKDSFQRGTGQILPTARRVMYAAQMLSAPRLMEPVYLVDIVCSEEALDDVEHCLDQRRGEVFEEIPREGTVLRYLKAYLPVAMSFDFHDALRLQAHGQAFAHFVFDHWKLVDGDPLAPGPNELLDKIITPLRISKGLPPAIPTVKRYMDGMHPRGELLPCERPPTPPAPTAPPSRESQSVGSSRRRGGSTST